MDSSQSYNKQEMETNQRPPSRDANVHRLTRMPVSSKTGGTRNEFSSDTNCSNVYAQHIEDDMIDVMEWEEYEAQYVGLPTTPEMYGKGSFLYGTQAETHNAD